MRWAMAAGIALAPQSTLAQGSTELAPGGPPQGAASLEETLPFSASNGSWEGYSELLRVAARELGADRVATAARIDYTALRPTDALVIVHPTQPLDERSLSAFLAAGGRVAVLDDHGRSGGFLSRFGIVAQAPPADPEQRLRDNPDLPIAVATQQVVDGRERGTHPIAADVQQVVTNHPKVFEHPDLTSVLTIRDRQGRAHALALTGVIANRGRLFVMGDPSVFINLMIRYPDNRRLARGLVRYLSQSTPGDATQNEGETGKVYFVANHFDEVGSFGDRGGLLDDLERKLDDALEALASVETAGLPPGLSLGLAGALALWLLATQLHKQLRVPQLLSPSFTRPPMIAAQTGLSSRAFVLGSPHASPSLALAELEQAVRESVAETFSLDSRLTADQMVRSAGERGLPAESCERLTFLLASLRVHGGAKARSASPKVLQELHQESEALLSEMETINQASRVS